MIKRKTTSNVFIIAFYVMCFYLSLEGLVFLD